MKSDYLTNRIGRILLALSFIAGIGLAAGVAVQAQNRDRYENRDYRRDRRAEYRRDRSTEYRRDQNRDYRRNDQYGRNGTYGTYGTYGEYPNGRYGGYSNGNYGNRNGAYGNVSQVAINQGYQDGLYTGSSDAQRGQSYNPQRSHFYKNGHGDNGYNGGYQYEQAYRDGFLRGYQVGYGQYGGYNNGRNNGTYRRFPW